MKILKRLLIAIGFGCNCFYAAQPIQCRPICNHQRPGGKNLPPNRHHRPMEKLERVEPARSQHENRIRRRGIRHRREVVVGE